MSSAVVTFPAISVEERAEAAEQSEEERLAEAACSLLQSGPVCFKLSTRVKAGLLPWWKRRAYVYLCREAPERLRVPPKPAMQLTVFTSWARAVAECEGPDDQLLVMPFERSYSPNVLDVAVECRPLDPTDSKRFQILQSVFGHIGQPDTLDEISDRLTRVETRLAALEAKGKTCAPRRPD